MTTSRLAQLLYECLLDSRDDGEPLYISEQFLDDGTVNVDGYLKLDKLAERLHAALVRKDVII